MAVIDLHSHFFPDSLPDLEARFGRGDWPRIVRTGADTATVYLGARHFRDIDSACWDPARRLADMDRDGIDVQVISATPVLFSYGQPLAAALEIAQHMNDLALTLCEGTKDRLVALCQVPLQDIDAACAELSRAMAAGHRGVQIGNHVGERNMDDAGIRTFLAHCAAEGAAVLVHPWDMMARERTASYMAGWTVAMPAETQLGIVTLILGGGLDQLPPSLRLCFAHGGGSFAFLLGRLENAWHNNPVCRGRTERPPSAYLDRFFVDSIVHDPKALRFLVDVMGAERVMLGSDYPFPLGEARVGTLVREAGLDASATARLLGDNAVRFLELSADRFS